MHLPATTRTRRVSVRQRPGIQSFPAWAALAAGTVALQAQGNLIVNGGFESGTFQPNAADSGAMRLHDNSAAINGWTVDGGGAGSSGDIAWPQHTGIAAESDPWGFKGSEGIGFLDLTGYGNDGDSPHGVIELPQTVVTTIGTNYRLSSDVGGSVLDRVELSAVVPEVPTLLAGLLLLLPFGISTLRSLRTGAK